jgi:1-deoxy-D-xylulose 5-phosphate reductoisomerase
MSGKKGSQLDHSEENKSQRSDEEEDKELEEIAWILITAAGGGVGRRRTAWRLLYCCLYSDVCSHTDWSVGHAVSFTAFIICPVMLIALRNY